MLSLAATLFAFIVAHAALSRPVLRDRMVAYLGRSGHGALNGTISLLLLVAVFWAHRNAPYLELWPSSGLLRLAPIAAMPVACILLVAGASTPGAELRGDWLPGAAESLGIMSVTRHPIPWAFILWTGSHLLANGDAASALVFGTFLGFAAFGPVLVDQRRRRLCGDNAWTGFATRTATLPFAAAAAGRPIDWRGIGLWRAAAGLAVFLALMVAHPWLAGVPVIGF